jgi:hypothetical protein
MKSVGLTPSEQVTRRVLDDADEIGLDAWQQAWLERELKDAREYTFRFVFMPVPLFDPRGGK